MCKHATSEIANGDSGSESIEAAEDEVILIWKIPEPPLERNSFADKGVYPTGELMAAYESVDKAEDHIERLRKNSPSDRFGESMDDAPYQFTVSYQSIEDRDP